MRQANVTHSKTKKAFTIIELIVVITVIGILAVIVSLAYTGVQKSARDKSVLSDLDALDGIETQYGVTHNTGGLAWYSGSGVDPTLSFTPSQGDVIDVVVNSTDYCIRIYNPSSSYATLATALTKESSPGVCASLPASSAAQTGSPGGGGGGEVIANGGVVTTLVGTAGSGYVDGSASVAKFNEPYGIAADSSGNLYVTDYSNEMIRKITPSGDVSTLAGNIHGGSSNGTGTAASFQEPIGIAVDSSGNVYVGDSNNAVIRKITPAGVVTTFAGTMGVHGYQDGTGTAAKFAWPEGLAIDSSNNIYVADYANGAIRKITPAGVVTTLAGSPSGWGNYVDGTGTGASFVQALCVGTDSSGNVYVCDENRIRKITPAGVVTTVAGNDTAGLVNATGTAAEFNTPYGLTVDSSGNIYVADTGNLVIRKITPAGVVTTFAGDGGYGVSDGTGTDAEFAYPYSITITNSGTLYVVDNISSHIRQIQ